MHHFKQIRCGPRTRAAAITPLLLAANISVLCLSIASAVCLVLVQPGEVVARTPLFHLSHIMSVPVSNALVHNEQFPSYDVSMSLHFERESTYEDS